MLKNILVIDDDKDVLDIMEIALDYEGFGVVTSANTDNYQDLLREKQIDLVIIDYLLPRINGGEICNQIKRSNEFGHLPVIIFSAYPKVLQSLRSYGCDAFVPKPFDLDDIVGQIKGLLNRIPGNLLVNNLISNSTHI